MPMVKTECQIECETLRAEVARCYKTLDEQWVANDKAWAEAKKNLEWGQRQRVGRRSVEKLLKDRHDAREENARLTEERAAALEKLIRERDEAHAKLFEAQTDRMKYKAEVARLEGLILEAESDIKAMGIEAHPAVLMRLDRLVRRCRQGR